MIELLISFIYYAIKTVVFLHVFFWFYKEMTMGICRSKVSLEGKVVLITGGNKGMGLETSIALLRRGAKVIIGCRSTQNVENEIRNIIPDADVHVKKLDLSSTKSVREFADKIKSSFEVIDILINNAGMLTDKKKETEDGFELTIATNYICHALLNHLLLDLVKRAGQLSSDCSRIILVSDLAAADKRIASDFCNPRSDNKSYNINFGVQSMDNQYPKSKLAQIMYGKHLATLLEDENCNTIVASCHPGFVRTDAVQGFDPGVKRNMFIYTGYVVGKTALQGAQTTIHLALSKFDELSLKKENGKLFSDCRPQEKCLFWSLMPKYIEDPVACKTVWEETMQMLNI